MNSFARTVKPNCGPILSRRQYALCNIKHLRRELSTYIFQDYKLSPAEFSVVDEIVREIHKQKLIYTTADDLEDYCDSHPDEPECIIHEL